MHHYIWLEGVQTHNLKNLEVKLPLYQLVAVSGVSGSGKSSLVFHTLHAESYRRYIDSLSSFARQYLKAMPKPAIKAAHRLPPSIAVKQATSGYNKRSTVGSFTETSDLLRVIFTHECTTICIRGHGVLQAHTQDSIGAYLREHHSQQRIMLLAPLTKLLASSAQSQHSQHQQQSHLLAFLLEQGFVRLFKPDGSVVKIAAIKADNEHITDLHQWCVVMDRLKVSPDEVSRLNDGLAKSLHLGSGMVRVRFSDDAADSPGDRIFKTTLSCDQCDDEAALPVAELFAYNHPLGACPTCKGYGKATVWDWTKILRGASTIAELKVLNHKAAKRYRTSFLRQLAARLPQHKPIEVLDESELQWLKWGELGEPNQRDVVIEDEAQLGSAAKESQFLGLLGLLNRLNQYTSLSMRILMSKYKSYVRCKSCNGSRLNAWVRRYKMAGYTFSELQKMAAVDLHEWLAQYFAAHGGSAPAVAAYVEMDKKLGYLQAIGLGYLALDRPTRSLSGGEIQRIRMTKCLGLALSQTLYCLDEPTAGLHPLDTNKLIAVMKMLKDQGNTVVVVEHDAGVLAASDYLIEIGPQAGSQGGEVCFAGAPAESATLQRTQSLEPFDSGVELDGDGASQGQSAGAIQLKGAATHNLRSVDVSLPVQSIIGVCGVSGSGKTSLIRHTLYGALCQRLGVESKLQNEEIRYQALKVPAECFHDVLLMSQKPLGKTMRSHIASYLGIWSVIRSRFAATQKAKRANWTASDFSLNTGAGRCENCLGLGVIKEDMSFLGELEVSCSHCGGRRYKSEILEVTYQGKSIYQVLQMTVSEAYEFFAADESLRRVLGEVEELGLGYLSLGQATSTFSGGEAQRLKILKLLVNVPTNDQRKVLIFDEPTGGLSEDDIPYLWKKFQRLKQLGHTVVVVEHHLRVLKSVDWLIEVGPQAGDKGGEVVYQGHPEGLAAPSLVPNSVIAPFMYP